MGIGVVSFFLWPDLMAGAEDARSQPAPTLVDGSAPSDVANLGG
ncbi:MAG: hypothetical protein R2851_24170 [Caldilineaceae bacterium]